MNRRGFFAALAALAVAPLAGAFNRRGPSTALFDWSGGNRELLGRLPFDPNARWCNYSMTYHPNNPAENVRQLARLIESLRRTSSSG